MTVEEILGDISNIEVTDFDTMLGAENQKSYKKRSMVFISQIVSELKKTKVFKSMVDKAAKDKLREEEQKQKQKQDRWLNKKGQAAGGATGSQNTRGRRGSIKNLPNRGPNQHSSTVSTNNVIEEVSSNSSDTERVSPTKGVKKGVQNSKTTPKYQQTLKGSQNKPQPKKRSQTRTSTAVDKGVQVNTYEGGDST